ncbi:hypothetical protein [Brevundimonas sp. NIBR10]|uniref:hypothetical protein n=1 Tax=Brevundimonas sp. NIBR10 TaxID=3015997 RepID=UPI0022F19596|nr:hypothetical protein [Brevundimonas sp. NIBR10]
MEIDARIASGVYENAAEFLRETVETSLSAQRPDVERWLRDEVGPTYDAYKADPSRLMSEEEAFALVDQLVSAGSAKT